MGTVTTTEVTYSCQPVTTDTVVSASLVDPEDPCKYRVLVATSRADACACAGECTRGACDLSTTWLVLLQAASREARQCGTQDLQNRALHLISCAHLRAGAKNIYPGVGVVMDASVAQMERHYWGKGMTLSQVSFEAEDAGKCSKACEDLYVKRGGNNVCHAWVFSRKPGQQDGDGQCRLLTEPPKNSGYYAYGVTWPINVAGSIMGTTSNEPLNVGGERVRWPTALSGQQDPDHSPRVLRPPPICPPYPAHRVPAREGDVHHRRGPFG